MELRTRKGQEAMICRRSTVAVLFVVSLGMGACTDTPTRPSEKAVEPFIGSLPPRLVTGVPTNYAGRWRGEYVRVACRANFAMSCQRDGFPQNRRIDFEFSQSATTVAGTVTMENGFVGSFSGYVSRSGGVAGTARSTNPEAAAWGQWFVVLELSGVDTLIGSLSDNGFRESTGAIISSRKYDITTPLRRIN